MSKKQYFNTFLLIYRTIVTYHTQTYEVPDEQSCPDHHVKCCVNHVEVAGNCLCM
jgi:hypothetical protein